MKTKRKLGDSKDWKEITMVQKRPNHKTVLYLKETLKKYLMIKNAVKIFWIVSNSLDKLVWKLE